MGELASSTDDDETFRIFEEMPDELMARVFTRSPDLRPMLMAYGMGGMPWAREQIAQLIREAAHMDMWAEQKEER